MDFSAKYRQISTFKNVLIKANISGVSVTSISWATCTKNKKQYVIIRAESWWMCYANKSSLHIIYAFCLNHSTFASQREEEEKDGTLVSILLTTQNFSQPHLLLFLKCR